MTHPKTGRRKSRRISFVVPEPMIQEFEAQCRADARLVSEGLRDAIRLYLRTPAPLRSVMEPVARHRYSGEELAHIAETLEADPKYAESREEGMLWERGTVMDGLADDNR